MNKLKEWIVNWINGFCMALADSVPGVSGGTVAFIMGFYDDVEACSYKLSAFSKGYRYVPNLYPLPPNFLDKLFIFK